MIPGRRQLLLHRRQQVGVLLRGALQRAPLLVYVHPNRYAVIEETQAFPLPERFER